MKPTQKQLTRLILATMVVVLAAGCANRQRRSDQTEAEYGYNGYEAYDPYANPNGSGYAEDIPLTGRPEGGVSFYGDNVNRNLFPPVYFAFDEYEISSAEIGKVQQIADHLRMNPDSLIIAGHTDLVGTTEYNRNLGELRAIAVRSALSEFGVASDRIHTVSFGEDNPALAGEDESANSANRRAEFGFYR